MAKFVKKCPCLRPPTEEVRTLDYRHSNLKDVPAEIFNFERTLEELFVDSNEIRDLPKELFYCHGLRKLTLSDNEITAIPPAISSLVNLEEIDISKNGIIDMPENIKCCKYLRILETSVNPLGKIPEGFTQLLNLTELYLNDTFLDYLPGNFGRLSKLKILEIRENNLKTLPKSLSRLVSLERLDIGQNQFTELEDVIGHMTGLLELWCDSNKIGTVTKGLGNLKQLMFMDACKNRIQVIPDEIEGCSSLADLHLTTNRLQALPETLGALENLTTLKVDDNSLFSLPSTMGGLASLSELNVSANDLEELPPSIGFLRNLRTFYADENLLMSLPPELGSCSGITVLSIRSNRLTYLPDEIGRIPGLRVVNVSDNKLVNLPFSVVKLKHLQAMWLSENQTKPLIPLQSELDPETDRKVLTCYLLPQGAMEQNTYDNNEDAQSFHPSIWEEERHRRQQIHFAGFTDDDFNDEGHLVRCPTPFPKEMREKARHARNLALRQGMGSNGEVHPTHCHDNMAYESEGHNSQRSTSPNRVSVGALRGRGSPDARVREARITKPSSPSLHNTHRLFLCDKEKTQKDKARMRLNSPTKTDMGKSPKGGKSARRKSDFSVSDHNQDETDTGADYSNRDRDKAAEPSQQNDTIRQTPTYRKSEPAHQGSQQRLSDNPQVMRLRPGSANVSDSRYKYSDRTGGHMTSSHGRKLPTPNMVLSPEFQYNGNHSLPLNSSRHSQTGRSRRGREYDSDTGYRSDTRSDIGYRNDAGYRSDTGCRSDIGYRSDQDVFRTRRQAMLLMYGPRGAGGSHGQRRGDNSMGETSSEHPRKPRHREGYASDIEAYSGRLFKNDVSQTNNLHQQQLRNTARSVPKDLHQEGQGHSRERPKSEHFIDPTYRPYPSKISLRSDDLYSSKTLPGDRISETDLKFIPPASSPASFHQGNFVDQSTPVATDPSELFSNQTDSKPSTPRSQNSDTDSKGGNWRRELYTVLEQKMQSTLNLQENNSQPVNGPNNKSLREGGGAVGRGRTPPPYHPAPPYYPATNSHSSSRQLPRTPQDNNPHYSKTDEQWTHAPLVNRTPNPSHHPQIQSHHAQNQSHHVQNQSHHAQNQSHHAPYDLSEDGGGYSPGLYPDNIDSSNPPLSRYDDVALFKSPEPISHVSSSTDSGYDHGHPIYERLDQYGRNNSGCGSSTPSSTPRFNSSSPMAPGSSQENSSVPHSREITPIKGLEDSQGRELFKSLQYSSQKTFPSNIFEISISKNPGLGFSIAGGLGSCGNPFRKQDQGIFVTKVHNEGPAAQSIQPGDKLVQVNGVNFNHIDHDQAVAILKNCSTVNLLVERR